MGDTSAAPTPPPPVPPLGAIVVVRFARPDGVEHLRLCEVDLQWRDGSVELFTLTDTLEPGEVGHPWTLWPSEVTEGRVTWEAA